MLRWCRAPLVALCAGGLVLSTCLPTLLVTTLVAAAAPAGPSAGTSTIAWHRCGDGFRCGTLAVPLDPTHPTGDATGDPTSDPAGEQVDLAVIMRPARVPDARRGSLVVNPGGPGMSGVDFLRSAADSFPGAVQDAYDLVSFDPRGVGASDAVDCVESLDPLFTQEFSPTTAAGRDALVQQFRTVATGCATKAGDILTHLSTRETAQDLDRLRAALGDERLDYVGYSYGTYLGALYAQAFPDRVGRMVLDGPVDPSLDGAAATLSQVRGFERSLDAFLAWCAADSTCSFHHDGDSAAAYDALRAEVAADPVAAKDQPGRVLDQTRFDTAVLSTLYSGRPAWRSLERALTSTEEGNSSTMLEIADSYEGRGADGRDDGALEAFWATTCRDGPVVGDVAATEALAAEATRIAPRLGAYIVNTSMACAVWPVPPLAPTGRIAAPGTPPILVVGTTKDPATPYEQAQALAGQLSAGVLLTVAGSQHTSFAAGNACADRVITRFLVTGRAPAAGTRC